MSEILFNKFEKEKKVIELHKQGKTIRQIAPIVHMSFTDISKKIKQYDKNLKLKTKKENNENKRKVVLKSSQAYELFLQGKKPVEVAILLNLDFQKVRNYWTEFLRLQNMRKLYNIYIENEFHLDSLFRIYFFILRNDIHIGEMENVLRTANDVINLNNIIVNLKAEIERLEQMKNNHLLNQKTNYKPLLPLGLPKYYYEQL